MVSSVSKLHTYDEKNNRKRRPMLCVFCNILFVCLLRGSHNYKTRQPKIGPQEREVVEQKKIPRETMLSPDILPTSHNTVVCGNPRLSLEMLEERRRETQSIRQLWNNLQSHKHRLRQHHHFLSRVSSARVNRRDIAPSVFTRFTESAPPVYYGVSRSKKNTDASDSAEIPIKTAISKRPPKQQNIDRYNALTQKLIIRLPNVYDRPIGLPSYSYRDIREWKNEVTKVVPKRTPIYTTTASDPRDMTLILPPESKSTKDSLCYFQPVSPRRKGRGKDYVVNPEWPSEDVTPRSVRDRAHCVYNWPL